ncbi:MAG: DUF1810 domain-containing protein, partial [Solirubrobacteraceae bacterium]
GATHEQARVELRAGRKTGHWMWFVFPQIAGLGHSPTSRRYAIASLQEARAYLADPELGPRLTACAQALADHAGISAEQILGGVDALKLRSSMTLFARADPQNPVFDRVLEIHFGGVPDEATDRLL